MKMHSCFDCKFRKLPLKDTPCDKGVVEKGGLVLQCLGWRERKTRKAVRNELRRNSRDE